MRILKIVIVCLLVHGCGGSPDTPEEALQRWVADAQAATENKDHGALMSMLSRNYADARGNDKDAIDQMLRFYFLRQGGVVLVSKIEDIVVSGGTAATIRLTAGMAGGSRDNALGFSADAYRFELELEDDGDDWLLVAARWGPLGQKLR
jgi:hypothetical protein